MAWHGMIRYERGPGNSCRSRVFKKYARRVTHTLLCTRSSNTPFLLLLRERLDILQPVMEVGKLGGVWFRAIKGTKYVKVNLRRFGAAAVSIPKPTYSLDTSVASYLLNGELWKRAPYNLLSQGSPICLQLQCMAWRELQPTILN